MRPARLALAAFLVCAAATSVSPAAAQMGEHCDSGPDQTLAAIPLVLLAGTVRSQLCTDDEVPTITSPFRASVAWSGPGVLAGGATTTVNTLSVTGCTANAWVNTADVSGAGSGGTSTTTFFMSSSTQCRADVELVVTFGTPVAHTYRWKYALNTNIATLDVQDRGCNAAAAGTACTRPFLNIGQWPALQSQQSQLTGELQFEANGPSLVLPDAGSVDVPLIVTALSPPSLTTGTFITLVPTVNAVAGGNGVCTLAGTPSVTTALMNDGSTQNTWSRAVTVDADYCLLSGIAVLGTTGGNAAGRAYFQWVLARDVGRLTGTLNNVLSGTVNAAVAGSLTLAGIPDTQQEIQAVADAIAAGIDVTICPADAPCYQVLSGSVATTSNTTITNQTNNLVGPLQLTVCGAPSGPGECPPVSSHSSTADYWPLWLAVAIFAVSALSPRRTNNAGICLAGLMFVFAGFAIPFHDHFGAAESTAFSTVIILVGLFVLVAGIFGLDGDPAVGAYRERRAAKKQARAAGYRGGA